MSMQFGGDILSVLLYYRLDVLCRYMYTHHEPWGSGPMPDDERYHLSAGLEKTEAFWRMFISRAEQALAANGVVPRPTADGDLGLRGMRFGR